MELTAEQQAAFNKFVKFFKDPQAQVLIIKGQAGTGKTVLLNKFYEYLKQELCTDLCEKEPTFIQRILQAAAPTGKAAQNISERFKIPAHTIHKTIYSNTDIRHKELKNKDGTKTYKFYYAIFEIESKVFLLIDEASMISDQFSEGEFFTFGSGKLLKDLIHFAKFQLGSKIVFFGDKFQLPPINMNFSPALDKQYLNQKYNLNVQEFELKQVQRQSEGSDILQLATEIRQQLEKGDFNVLSVKPSDQIVVIRESDLLPTYIALFKRDADIKIITETNSRSYELNQRIREQLFQDASQLHVGEKLIVVRNLYFKRYEVFNGDEVIVRSVAPYPEVYGNLRVRDSANVTQSIELKFRDVEVELPRSQGIVKMKILETLLFSNQRDLSSEQEKALYQLFFIKNPSAREILELQKKKHEVFEKELVSLTERLRFDGTVDSETYHTIQDKLKDKEYYDVSVLLLKTMLRNDPYFNALRVKFAHAITCHKAQGSEWQNVIVDAQFSQNFLTRAYFQWFYTAITRAKRRLYLLNLPDFSEKVLYISADDLAKISENLRNSFPGQIQMAIAAAVLPRLTDADYQVFSIEHHQWQEKYTLLDLNEELHQLQIYYNAKNKISRIQADERVKALLHDLEGKIVYIVQLSHESEHLNVVKPDFTESKQGVENEQCKEFSLEKAQSYSPNALIFSCSYRKIVNLLEQGALYDAFKNAEYLINTLPPDQENFAFLAYLKVVSAFIDKNLEQNCIAQALIWLKHWLEQKVIYYDQYLAKTFNSLLARLVKYFLKKNLTLYAKRLITLIQTSEHKRPSLVHSFILEQIIKLKELNVAEELYQFLKWWNFDNLREEDFLPRQIKENQINSLAEAAFNAFGKVLIKKQQVQLNDLHYLESVYRKRPDYFWIPYYVSKLYIKLGRKDLAYQYFIPIALQKGQTDWWVWATLAEILDERELKIYAYSKALTFKVPEKNLVKVYLNLAKLLAEFDNQTAYNLAKTLIYKVVTIRKQQGWRITSEISALARQQWFKQAQVLDFQIVQEKLIIKRSENIVDWLYENAREVEKFLGVILKVENTSNVKWQKALVLIGRDKTIKFRIPTNRYKRGEVLKIYMYHQRVVYHKKQEDIQTDYAIKFCGTIKSDGRHLSVKYQSKKIIIPRLLAEQQNLKTGDHICGIATIKRSKVNNEFFWSLLSVSR